MQVQADQIWVRRNRVREIFAFLKTLIPGLLLCLSVSSSAAQTNAKNVLVLYSFADRHDFSAFNDLKAGLERVISEPLNFYVENLEGRRFDDEVYKKYLTETLRNTYRGVRLDIVIAENDPALEFALSHREDLFPGIPIVFYDVDDFRIVGQDTWPGVTGVTAPVDVQGTIDLALHVNQDTNAVAVMIGNSPYERYWLGRIHSELLRYQGKVQEIDLVGLSPSQLLERVTALPRQTVVLFQMDRQESAEPAVGTYTLLTWIADRWPTYCVTAWYCVTHGGIGGDSYDGYRQISLLAQQFKLVLSGKQPENVPIVHDSWHRFHGNWQAIRHWHIPESALPAGSVILYRPPSFWEQYRRYVIAAAVVIALLLLLVIGLLWERARKLKAEAHLRESEKRFRVMADTTPSLVWMCDPQGKITYLNERRVAFTGRDPDAGFSDLWTTYIHPDDQKNVLDVVSHALETRRPFTNEYRLRRSDGVYRWMLDVASPRVNGDRSFAGFISSGVDVTDQKLAQQALEKVSGQLIEAQENERRRIARDLHDDICQRLALLSMELDQANRSANESADVAKQRISEIRQHCAEIAGDVQSLSHELHSSRLDYLGIVAAISGFCHEFSQQHEVSIEFAHKDVPTDLPRDISLCLFRVAQEALHNAVKYSGVSQYAVELRATAEEIQLVVSDAGAGFDVEATQGSRGLGLVSMQERVHLVQGRLHVESEPGKGTKILAVVPLTNGKEGYSEGRGIEESKSVVGAA